MIKIISETLKRRKLVLFLSFMLLLTGIYSYITIPKQEMPDLIVPIAVVQVVSPGVSASEMEEITTLIEATLENYEEIDNYTTITLDNVMIAQIFYDFSVKDTETVSSKVEDDILNLELGDRIESVHVRTDFDIPHAVYAFTGESVPILEDEAERFREEILEEELIRSTKIKSTLNTYVDVFVPNEILGDLSIVDVYGLIYANSQSIPLGSIDGNTIQVDASFSDIEDIENIIVTYVPNPFTGGVTPVTLGEFAEVQFGEYDGKEYFKEGEKTVFLEVYFDEDIDFSLLGKRLTERYNDFDSDVEISEYSFLPDYVDYQINQAMSSLLLCIVIVMIVVFIGLGFRNSLAIAITIPIIVFGTILGIDLLGYELQRVSIAGIVISIGILVDNSIVISDAIQFYMDKGVDVFVAAKRAVKDNGIAVLSSTLTTVAAFIPLTMLPGLAGKMAKSLPITVMLAIALSYVFAMIVTPVIATYIFKARKPRKKKEIFKKIMGKVLEYPRVPVYISFMVLLTLLFFVLRNQPIDIFPSDEKSEFYIDFTTTEIDRDSAVSLTNQISNILDDYNEIETYYYSIGGGLPAFSGTTRPVNEVENEGRFYVHTTLEFDELGSFIDELNLRFYTIQGDIKTNQVALGIASAPVELSIVSDDLSYLEKVSENVSDMLAHKENVESYSLRNSEYSDTYQLRVNRELLAQNGIQMVELQNFIYTNLNGLQLNAYQYDGKLIDVYIHSDIDTLEDMLDLEFNGIVLDDLVEVYKDTSLGAIYKYNGDYQVYLEASPSDSSALKLEGEIKDYLSNYNVEVIVAGDSELANTIFGDIGQAAIIAIVLIYIIMFIQFNSFNQPMIVFFTIPLSLIGSFAMMLLFDTPISLMSLLGIVSLIGVVVNTGILLVEYINKAIEDGMSKKDACINSVDRRFRPIVLASTTTILGLIPLMLNGGEFFSPLAIVFMGGIISTMILTIIVVPCLYMLFVKEKHS